jgi:hypothetical protein
MRNGLWIIVVGGLVGAMLASTALAAPPRCNPNGVLEQGEPCDPGSGPTPTPTFRGNATCQSLGFDGGTVACTSTC